MTNDQGFKPTTEEEWLKARQKKADDTAWLWSKVVVIVGTIFVLDKLILWGFGVDPLEEAVHFLQTLFRSFR